MAIALCLGLSSGCISTWSDFPDPASAAPDAARFGTLHYDIAVAPGLFGGGDALRDAFRERAPFARVEPLSEPPKQGLFCRVDHERRSPSLASGFAAYISYALLFTIPFWGSEGYTLRYHLYLDGQEQKIHEYDITRKSFFWIVALPFAWVNLLTPSERDAFTATVGQFFSDAQPFFEAHAAASR
jgi:hypothetical protein